jgi:hypothetical protein
MYDQMMNLISFPDILDHPTEAELMELKATGSSLKLKSDDAISQQEKHNQ